MITIKTKSEVEKMRQSGKIAALILKDIEKAVLPGVKTSQLNDLAKELIKEHGVMSAFKGYQDFPGVICTSINDIVVHGIPDETELKEGDVLGLDFGVIYDGWYSDMAITVGVGHISYEAARIIKVAKKALRLGIKKARPGNTTEDIGNTIQRYVEDEGFHVVRELVGHGIGKNLHEDPPVPNYGKRHLGTVLEEGMVIAIEPMVVAGPPALSLHSDEFGYKSKHNFLTAHFEHTVAITAESSEVLTDL
ncbi:MAG: type I methionyl aminopeptidase [Candidatus Spechtbacteria bacterium]|nr:type I methionyl aminopeptidase [Candidatus Spechtbacteria bacterium]